MEDNNKQTKRRKTTTKEKADNLVKHVEDLGNHVVKGVSDFVDKNITPETIEKVKKEGKEFIDTAKSTAKTAAKKAKEVSDPVIDAASKTVKKVTADVKKTAAANKTAIKPELYIQSLGNEISEDNLVEKFKEIWLKDHNISEIKDLKIYYKVEEGIAYFVVNGESTTAISLF